LSRISVVIFALVSVIGFLSYAFQGIGKFASVIFPWELSNDVYAIILMGITTIYVILGGMYSVVITDLLQFTILAIASFFIGFIAITKVSPDMLAKVVPAGWDNIFFGWTLDLDWSNLIPSVNNQIVNDGWSFFTIIFMMMVFKGLLLSMAGPAPNYDMQRVLATRRPKESAFMSGVVSICLFPRWLMITGITVLALAFYSTQLNQMGPAIDFEKILPYVINNFIPTGLLGLLLAGLLAAFMSTFDATVNAGAAYIVNDIYKRYLNPHASDKRYVAMSYLSSIAVVIVGMIAGMKAESINAVMQWIVSGLWGGYTAPNVLKWYWWRFNGHGYFWGMITGIIAAIIFLLVVPPVIAIGKGTMNSALLGFPFILITSGAVAIIASLLTPPDDSEVLQNFYRQVRPWGFWKPIYRQVIEEFPEFQRNASFKRDLVNIAVGILWQMTLVVIPIYLIIQNYKAMWISVLILIVTSVFLKCNWINKLEEN